MIRLGDKRLAAFIILHDMPLGKLLQIAVENKFKNGMTEFTVLFRTETVFAVDMTVYDNTGEEVHVRDNIVQFNEEGTQLMMATKKREEFQRLQNIFTDWIRDITPELQ